MLIILRLVGWVPGRISACESLHMETADMLILLRSELTVKTK